MSRREAKLQAKIAVLEMLDQVAAEFFGQARYSGDEPQHSDLVESALANAELGESLARQWRLVRK